MNFLGHLYLSHPHPEKMIGNFIADHVKGSNWKNYPKEIQDGILMHREIDAFTDSHPQFRSTSKKFRDRFSKFAPVITDIVYDHFLAANWRDYHDESLEKFSSGVYSLMLKNTEFLPEKSQFMLSYMHRDNWLLNYSHLAGIEKTLSGMSRRIGNGIILQESISELQAHYNGMQEEWILFIADCKVRFGS